MRLNFGVRPRRPLGSRRLLLRLPSVSLTSAAVHRQSRVGAACGRPLAVGRESGVLTLPLPVLEFRILILTAVAAVTGGCVPAPVALVPDPLRFPSAEAVVGCWALEPLGWENDPILRQPLHVRFDSTVRFQTESQTLLTLELLETSAPRPAASVRMRDWGVRADDETIHAVLGTGFTGLRFQFIVRDGTLEGRARTFSDTWPSWSSGGRIHGTRIGCAVHREDDA
jgi:hypothetical protein